MKQIEWYEFVSAVNVANARFIAARTAGLEQNGRSGYKSWSERMKLDIVGTCAEILVAKNLGTYFPSSVNTFHSEPDLMWNGTPIEVRSTIYPNGKLIVRDNDPENSFYVLVVGDPPNQRIAGKILGIDAKFPDYWVEGKPGTKGCWMVDQSDLNPLSHLLPVLGFY